jgi:hypothetical protein
MHSLTARGSAADSTWHRLHIPGLKLLWMVRHAFRWQLYGGGGQSRERCVEHDLQYGDSGPHYRLKIEPSNTLMMT